MDRKMMMDHLAIAEKAIALSEDHIGQEEQAIADLDRAGHDTRHARETLATFRRMRAEYIAHCKLLLEMLQQDHEPNLQPAIEPIFRPGHYERTSDA